MEGKIIKVNISDLKPHPENEKIYGANEDISSLKEKIRKSGLVTTLTITDDNVILSGNRRWKSCKQLVQEGDTRFCAVDCEVRTFDNEEDELEYLVICNDTREKTMEQKAREAQMLLEVEKIRAKKRQATSTGGAERQLIPKSGEAEKHKGKSSDAVAKKLHMRSGHEVDRIVKSVKKIDELQEQGRQADSELVRTVLNEGSPSAACDLSNHIDELTEDEKQAIRDKKMSAYKVISKYATKRTPKITDEMSAERKAELAHEQACKEAVEEYIAQSLGLIDISDVPVDDRTDDLIAFFNTSVGTLTAAITNLLPNVSKFSEEQANRMVNILNKIDKQYNQIKLTVAQQMLNIYEANNSNNPNEKIIPCANQTLEERAKRLKDDSEIPLTVDMIMGTFQGATNNYLESVLMYIDMIGQVKDKSYNCSEVISKIAIATSMIINATIDFKEMFINNSNTLK